MTDPFFTRRKFLRTVILGGAIAPTVPSFVNRTFAALDGVAASSDCNRTEIDRDHIECRFRASKDSCPHFCEEAVRPLALY